MSIFLHSHPRRFVATAQDRNDQVAKTSEHCVADGVGEEEKYTKKNPYS